MPAPADRPAPVALDEWVRALPFVDEAGGVALVDLGDGRRDVATSAPAAWPFATSTVVGLVDGEPGDPDSVPAARWCDVVVDRDDDVVDDIVRTVAEQPVAARALVTLLRTAPADPLAGLVVESATYSALQAGPGFAAWRAARPVRQGRAPGDAVLLHRAGGALTIVLDRPEVRNALNRTMRDQLVDALRLASADDSITEVHLRGAGPSFCAGGDLDEFGSFADPASAHLLRLDRSVGRALLHVAHRTTAHLHGHAVGSGIELPAFASRVVADPGATFGLPELSIGLIPGAGGTVSLPRRIGRHRTARLALSGEQLDVRRALAWGLVDEIAPVLAAG